MKYIILSLFIFGFISLNCSNTVTGPTTSYNNNLLANSTFEANEKPSLIGWNVPDTSAFSFSSDIPQGGSGSSIIMNAAWVPGNIIFTSTIPQLGSHSYKLSIFGKYSGVGGKVSLYLNRPENSSSTLIEEIPINSNAWSHYSQTKTISATDGDTLFVIINGGETELAGGTTYFNTCRLEKLN